MSTISADYELASLAMILRTVADPARVGILRLLGAGQRSVKSITAAVGMPQSTVSHHLACMRIVRLVTARRDGKEVHYSLSERFTVDEAGNMVLSIPGATLSIAPANNGPTSAAA